MVYGVVVELILVTFFVYTPAIQTAMGSANADYKPWVVGCVVGTVIWIYNEWRKKQIREYPSGNVARYLAW